MRSSIPVSLREKTASRHSSWEPVAAGKSEQQRDEQILDIGLAQGLAHIPERVGSLFPHHSFVALGQLFQGLKKVGTVTQGANICLSQFLGNGKKNLVSLGINKILQVWEKVVLNLILRQG